MTEQDKAIFEVWLERLATPEERKLPYEEQLKAHILWLSGWNEELDLNLFTFTREEKDLPQ